MERTSSYYEGAALEALHDAEDAMERTNPQALAITQHLAMAQFFATLAGAAATAEASA